ncbi:phage major capsid protein [Rhizobium laguerreae]|uniref:phage major capsid protein n=1 Tax=Rhizobium laguerreae TaxID=1076926 RepID=UPI00143F32BE|nr:phage major capsid protein [Rhizobium laguerreae]NKM86357.1 phage major capsid protein [Rhizobium laguerreae]
MTKHVKIETRSAQPIETRQQQDNQNNDDPLAAATRAVEEMRTAAETRHTAHQTEVRGLTDRITQLETRLNRPGGQQQEQQNEQAATERRAFGTYLRFGAAAPAEELRTLVVSTDTQGGYLAPAEMSSEMIRDIVQVSPIRSVASVRSTGSPSVVYPKRTQITNAKWKGEGQAQEASETAFGQAEIAVKEVNTYVDISNQLLADSAGQAETEVRIALADDFGQKEGAAFVNGDGALAPEGLLTNGDIATVLNGHATNLSTDQLIKLMYAIPAPYRSSGTWGMNGTTLGIVRSLKDGQGNYLWQPSFQAGQPETILGRPVIELPDMPDLAANAFPIIFGDFTGYRIVDRIGLSILVNPYLLATNGLTRIHATRRVGGGVIQAAKFRKLKMATS